MNTRIFSTSTFVLCLFAWGGFVRSPGVAAEPPVVILKLDDFRPGGKFMPDGWQMTTDFLAERKLKASYGVIGKDLVRATPAFCDWARRQQGSGMIEFWNHGYTHGRTEIEGEQVAEFRDRLESQLASLKKTQDIGKEKLGITFAAFGAPFNQINGDTARALRSNGELKLWLYGYSRVAKEGGYTGIVLPRVINLETPVHQPNFKAFKEQYDKGSLGECIVLQGHPQSWASEKTRFENFVQIIDFLQKQGCVFTTPSEYAAALK